MFSRGVNMGSTAKTAEIMSRYRPIAPRPELSMGPDSEDNGEPQKIKQSPYLQSVWANLQARPTRTRKRGRTSLAPPTIKRHRPTQFLPIYPHGSNGLVGLCPDNFTLPILPCPVLTMERKPSGGPEYIKEPNEDEIDLNRVPEERDFIQQLQGPVSPSVIAPQAIRPVGSSISVGCINEEQKGSTSPAQIPKKRQEVEDEMEQETLPAVVSDTNNNVRLANAAYKEMVGQPECSWLDTMAHHHNTKVTSRICGQVMLHFSHHESPPREDLLSSNGFSCWATIEWGRPNEKNCSVHAFCDVIRLSCESTDYAFEWRFHPQETK